jgi:Protein of unknown function (DUF3147)
VKIKIDFSAPGQTKWHQYATRFLLGGGISVVAGLIAKRFGPTIGGLFLAFPAIFPASATLIEKHEQEKKLRVGASPGHRGQDAAALDAAGASMGSLGLISFAVVVWRMLPEHSLLFTLAISIAAWLVVSVTVWRISEHV